MKIYHNLSILLFWHVFHATLLASPISRERVEEETKNQVNSKTNAILSKYCSDSCQLVDVSVTIIERISELDNLGFEGVGELANARSYSADKIYLQIQIDNRQTKQNRQKLEILISNSLRNLSNSHEIRWLSVDLPNVDESASVIEVLQNKLKSDLSAMLKSVIQKYCPDNCILSNILIDGSLITPDDAETTDPLSLLRGETGHSYLKINNIDIDLSIDEKIPEKDRENILELMRSKTKFVRPISFNINIVNFPESYAEKKEKLQEESKDPYGLEKLRRTLTLFKELAGTKEIISTTSSNSSSSQNSSATSSKEDHSKVQNSEQKDTSDDESSHKIFIYLSIFLGLIFIFAIVFLKISQAQKDAKILINQTKPRKEVEASEGIETTEEKTLTSVINNKDLISKKLAIKDLKKEITDIFVNVPKVAQETFTRFLQEEGVEETAKYVHIFGKMIVFELLNDPALQRNLYDLSEYYHKSGFNFSTDEELTLLNALKTKVVAGEIKVLARQTLNQFDFLNVLDPNQVYQLVSDETPKVQSIVLTQLSPKRRRNVFELFEGQAKIDLMRELSRVEAIPKEYLFNVAAALTRKVKSKPEFDTQSLRSSDILLELLERSTLKEQRQLMKNLSDNNAEAARTLKLKLVTIEILPYLKDGHLLEIVFAMDRSDLLIFLLGCPDHIRHLILSKAPEELRNSWLEELQNTSGVDESTYRLVEMIVLSKIRQLSSQGAVRLLEINEMIFQETKANPRDAQQIVNHKNLVA